MPGSARKAGTLKLIEIHREDIESLPEVDGAPARQRFPLHRYSATTSPSTAEDTSYKSLKAVLEGGIEGRPDNVILYATSNRRHLMARDMIDNERSTAINPGEAVRRRCRSPTASGSGSASTAAARTSSSPWWKATSRISASRSRARICRARPLEWATTRGSRSGRVACSSYRMRRDAWRAVVSLEHDPEKWAPGFFGKRSCSNKR